MDCIARFEVIKRVDVITINDEETEYSLVKTKAKIWGQMLFKTFNARTIWMRGIQGDTFAGGFAGFITQSENVSFENMKNAIIYGSNLLCRNFGTERMISLDKNEVVSRLKQFKSLTQFDIEL
jgi:hypothetical protein